MYSSLILMKEPLMSPSCPFYSRRTFTLGEHLLSENFYSRRTLLSENVYSRGTFNFVLEILRVRKLKSLDLRITNHISLISRLFKASTTFLFVCFLLRQIMLFCLQTVTLYQSVFLLKTCSAGLCFD